MRDDAHILKTDVADVVFQRASTLSPVLRLVLYTLYFIKDGEQGVDKDMVDAAATAIPEKG